MSDTLDNARGNNPNDNDLDAVFDAMAKEYPQPDIPLQPITPRHDAALPTNEDSGTPQNAQDNAEEMIGMLEKSANNELFIEKLMLLARTMGKDGYR